jgi:glyoxylase-like metal-dependent hydrolase (beta-lactamase superfamily II)
MDSALTQIEAIALPTPFSIGDVNVFLIDDGVLTLVDTGPLHQPTLAALEEALRERGRRVEDLELILLTHQHYDHFGLTQTLKTRSGARVAAIGPLADMLENLPESMRAEDRFAVNVMHELGVPEDAIRANVDISAFYRQYGESVEVDDRLEEGDIVDVGRRQLRVLCRPGHSPTDTVFLDDAARTAFVGDHLLARISSNPVAHRPISGSEDPADREPALVTYLESLAQTRQLDVDLSLAGHRKPIQDHKALIDERVGHHRDRAETILGLVRSGHATATDLSFELWGSIDPTQTYLAVSEILGHIDLLVRDGTVAVERSEGGSGFVAA